MKKIVTNMKRIVFILSTICLASCSSGSNGADPVAVFSSTTKTLAIEVAYMSGAEPYVGKASNDVPYWNFLKRNLDALFDSTKTLEVPTTLKEMKEIPAGKANYSSDDIQALAETYRELPNLKNGIASFFILFLDGYFTENGKTSKNTLGVSLGNTGILAVFKPVIKSATLPFPNIQAFVEQSVLIHETGHALGLVNNGLPLQSDHHDSKHGTHCKNKECVMYYLNEGTKDLIEFLNRKGIGTDDVIFGAECLKDAHAAL